MRTNIGACVLAAAVVLIATVAVGAQVDISKPIAVKTLKPKLVKFQGEFLHANNVAITVRSRENERVIRTFTYSPKVQEQMQRIIDEGGYQYGDKVAIEHAPGEDVALRIKGKPSRPR